MSITERLLGALKRFLTLGEPEPVIVLADEPEPALETPAAWEEASALEMRAVSEGARAVRRPKKAARKPAVRKTSLRGAAKKKKTAASSVSKRASPAKAPPAAGLERHERNPILQPEASRRWESKAAFNPAAAHRGGKVHLLYRAIGDDDVSVLGYASSRNGRDIDDRSETPAYAASGLAAFEASRASTPPVPYGSGGGWNGGCEDPRLTFIGKDAYLFYTAFDGWGSIRIGMTSIDAGDFLRKRWRWRPQAFLSPPGEIHKNWVLFPQKIGGKFAILHSISPRIQIAYLKSLKDLKGEKTIIKSRYEKAPRGRAWDSWVRGAGPPPIKTKDGWLLLYHAMDDRDPGRYKLGAMLLDLKNPEKIVARSKKPILEPDECYENEGFKSGVVYCCGAVVKDGRLIIYYGGADTVVCAAETPLEAFLHDLKKAGKAVLPRSKAAPAAKRKRHAAR